MNNERRDTLRQIDRLLSQAHALLTEVRDDEENALAAMPESFQFGMKGAEMESAISDMDEALMSLESAREYLEEAAA